MRTLIKSLSKFKTQLNKLTDSEIKELAALISEQLKKIKNYLL